MEFRVVSLLMWSSLFSGAVCFADAASYLVHVREIEASSKIETAASPDIRLQDLTRKLTNLNFKSFKLVSEDRRDVPSNQEELVRLGAGRSLTIKPAASDTNKKICLWIQWKDEKGEELLNTSLHFPRGESVITGTDQAGEDGLILAIDVQPRP